MGFCPRCGKETDYRLCLDCLRTHHPLVEHLAPVTITLCPQCARTFTKNTWGRAKPQDVLDKALERAITFSQGARIEGVIVEPMTIEPGKQPIEFTVMGTADADAEEIYDEYYEIDILVQGNLCTECQNLKNQYFTGIIQLRRPNEAVQYEIERQLERALTNAKDVTGGIDYYVSDHHILQNVVRAVHNMFGGELTIRAQHFSYDNLASKNLYRVNACLRLPKYWKGSVIQAGSRIFLITNMGRALKGVDLESGKVCTIPCFNEYPELEQHTVSVVTVRPRITILEPETYQTAPVIALRKDDERAARLERLAPDAKINVVETPKGWLFVREADA